MKVGFACLVAGENDVDVPWKLFFICHVSAMGSLCTSETRAEELLHDYNSSFDVHFMNANSHSGEVNKCGEFVLELSRYHMD